MRRLIVILLVASGLGGRFAPVDAKPRKPLQRFVAADSLRWPAGTERLRFENVEGIVLLQGTLRGRMEADTTGPLALDTGAGYLALDVDLARFIGLADTTADLDAVDVASHPLPRLTLGGWTLLDVQPVLTVDGEIVRRVSDRPVLGLLGQKPIGNRVLWIDYREQVLAVIPSGKMPESSARATVADASESAGGDSVGDSKALLSGLLTTNAVPVPFFLVGDGKILVHGTVADPTPGRSSRPLNLIVDTGATKCVLFEDALAPNVVHAERWPALRGLSAPTLIGTAEARIARVPWIELAAAQGRSVAHDVDVGVIRSELSQVLSRVSHATIHGLIGYSFLKRFRVAVDYRHHVLWLDPIPDYRDDRPLEYCHVGLQLERRGPAVVVVGVVDGSPAARAGITRGDEVVALDGAAARSEDLIALTRRMEGQPGRALTIVIRRDSVERTVRLIRRRLL
jgi:hypothetical protein